MQKITSAVINRKGATLHTQIDLFLVIFAFNFSIPMLRPFGLISQTNSAFPCPSLFLHTISAFPCPSQFFANNFNTPKAFSGHFWLKNRARRAPNLSVKGSKRWATTAKSLRNSNFTIHSPIRTQKSSDFSQIRSHFDQFYSPNLQICFCFQDVSYLSKNPEFSLPQIGNTNTALFRAI